MASPLLPTFDASGIEYAANNRIAEANIFDTTATQKHYRVFLKIVPDARNISRYFHAVGQAHSGNFSNGGIRFLGSLGCNLDGHSTLKRRVEQDRAIFDGIESARQSDRLRLAAEFLPLIFYKLIDG